MIPPVVRTVLAPASPPDAFRRFTAEMSTWWPTETHSVHLHRCDGVVFEVGVGGRIYERAGDRASEWGKVVEWQPPHRVVFSWYPGREPATAQRVEVTFEAEAGGTRVTLVHRGWEALGAAATETRERYDSGWVRVLAEFAASPTSARGGRSS
jgi:uncharacterized protein YndB with AHSA1/START domain